MPDSIGSLLGQRELFEPPEIKLVQDFVEQKFKIKPSVMVARDQIVVIVKSAALAGALRPLIPQLQDACQTQKRIHIRIHG